LFLSAAGGFSRTSGCRRRHWGTTLSGRGGTERYTTVVEAQAILQSTDNSSSTTWTIGREELRAVGTFHSVGRTDFPLLLQTYRSKWLIATDHQMVRKMAEDCTAVWDSGSLQSMAAFYLMAGIRSIGIES
jgi:hypothetical protein